ncbi:MAG: M28 family peptidase [Clostridiales bacterium]|jgi:hypothetical protein|nr:M28 family peptidase [Clostridiales bacterium]
MRGVNCVNEKGFADGLNCADGIKKNKKMPENDASATGKKERVIVTNGADKKECVNIIGAAYKKELTRGASGADKKEFTDGGENKKRATRRMSAFLVIVTAFTALAASLPEFSKYSKRHGIFAAARSEYAERSEAFETASDSEFSKYYEILTAAVTRKESGLTYNLLIDFAEKNPEREAGTPGCAAAAEYLSKFFTGLGYAPYDFGKDGTLTDERGGMPVAFERDGRPASSYNVLFVKPGTVGGADVKKKVIIGAHYDNKVYANNAQSYGASDNASGVAVMLALAGVVQDMSFPFDVVFAAFTAEEYGLAGSLAFVAAMTENEIENTLLMVNLDCIGGGDYLYLYTDEIDRKHGVFLTETAKNSDIQIRQVPRGRVILIEDTYSGLPYAVNGMASGHAPFFKAGINTALFMSANFEITDSFVMSESKEHPNIINTKDDTLENYLKYYGETGCVQGDAVVALLASAMLKEDFVSVMEESRLGERPYAVLYDEVFRTASYAGVAAILALLAFVMYRRVKGAKNDGENDGERSAENITVFEDFGI